MPRNTIVPAVLDDLPAIIEIYNSTIPDRRATADLVPVSVESRRTWFDAHTGNRPLYVVKNPDSEVLAWASFSDYYPRQAYHISAEISIYVRHDARGIGVGKTLLQYMVDRAPEWGIRNILAVIFGHNYNSIYLFESLGFREWGRLPDVCELDGKTADIVILGKALSSRQQAV